MIRRRKFVTLCLIPGLAALFLTWIIVKAFLVYSAPDGGYAKPIFGIGSPIAIALLMIVLGIVGMLIQRITMPEFFRREREIAPAHVLDGDPIAVGRHG